MLEKPNRVLTYRTGWIKSRSILFINNCIGINKPNKCIEPSRNSNMKICTWNSQGNPNNDFIKSQVLTNLLTRERCNVVMIQECSNFIMPANLSGIYSYAVIGQAGAYNCRCSTCIIADSNFIPKTEYLPSGTGRSAIGLNYHGYNIYTLHCESGPGAMRDIKHLIQKAVFPFIIGGDINANILDFPEFKYARINGIITVGTGSRPGQSARIVSCGSPTHISGNELDYFFIDNRLSLITKIDRYTLKGGDHYPVILEI